MASLDSPSRATSDPAALSTKAQDEDDLDPAAFLQSVRELSAKREREDNERFKKLEEEIQKGREERLARRADYARSILPEKRDSIARSSHSQAPPSRSSSNLVTQSPVDTSAHTTPMETPSSRSSTGVEEVPDFKGFGAHRSSTPSTPTKQTTSTPTTPVLKPSPSAAMPSRSGTMKWQQRPQSRGGASRPLSVVAAENSAQIKSVDSEPSRDQIAASLGARDPSWFRQTADRGVGNAAYRKSTDVDTSDAVSRDRKGLPGMVRQDSPAMRTTSSSTNVSRPESITSVDRSSTYGSRTVESQDTSLVESEGSTAPSQSSQHTSASMSTLNSPITRGLDRPLSPTKELGGFVQSAMMKRSNSINKRSVGQYTSGLDRASSIRSGYGGLQGSHSMPKLDQPKTAGSEGTDSLVRPSSSINLAATTTATTPSHHARAKSITSAYTTNASDSATSVPSSPSKRWSPNKSSWIESALTAKQDSRPAWPTKNSTPSWMSNLAKAKAQRSNDDAEASESNVGSETTATDLTKGSQPENEYSTSRTTATASTKSVYASQDLTSSKTSDSEDMREVRARSPTQSTTNHESTYAETRDADIVPLALRSKPSPSPKPQFVASMLDPVPSVSRPQPVFKAQPITPSPKQDAALLTTQSKPQPSPKLQPITTSPKQDATLLVTQSKPQPSPKPQIDFRSTLKPRAATEPKPQEQPEFLSRFGTLRKTATEKYVAPDHLKDNILRGKAGLAISDGPQKRVPRDELKESLLAKKDQWQQEKQAGIVHERKISAPPITPEKPEALAKRDVLGRTATDRASSPEKEKTTTPEALRRHQSIRQKPEPVAHALQKQNEPVNISKPQETGKPISFNSQLAGILARGPPSTPTTREVLPDSNASVNTSTVEEPSGPAEQLQDVRKGRAKGPKRRKAGAPTMESPTERSLDAEKSAVSMPGQLLSSSSRSESSSFRKPAVSPKPLTMQNGSTLGWDSDSTPKIAEVPVFKGFSTLVAKDVAHDDDKENNELPDRSTTGYGTSSPLPTPSKKDEEAAMRSARLLASRSSATPGKGSGLSGLGISTITGPPKPVKSSRSVSGQLKETSLNKVRALRLEGSSDTLKTDAQRQHHKIDARAALTSLQSERPESRTIQKILYKLGDNRRLEKVLPREEYVLDASAVYLLKHDQAQRNGTITTDVYTWIGAHAKPDDIEEMKSGVKAVMRDSRSATAHTIHQGYESKDFLRAIGGILITRTSTSQLSEQYMLCGRKHLGHIVFDEVGCRPGSLCSAFVYLIWNPVTLQGSTTYLWKGSSCSAEEVSGARLAAVDVSESGKIVEVDDGEETTSFWKVFSAWPFRENALPRPVSLKDKAKSADRFAVRLFRVQRRENKLGFFTNILSRRPSWGSRSPAPVEEPQYEATEILPFTQSDLDAESIYLLDGYTRLDVLRGPLCKTDIEPYQQMLHFAKDYANQCVDLDRRPSVPDVYVVLSGVPEHIPYLFRHWQHDYGLWGIEGLMAGSWMQQPETKCISLHDALAAMHEVDDTRRFDA